MAAVRCRVLFLRRCCLLQPEFLGCADLQDSARGDVTPTTSHAGGWSWPGWSRLLRRVVPRVHVLRQPNRALLSLYPECTHRFWLSANVFAAPVIAALAAALPTSLSCRGFSCCPDIPVTERPAGSGYRPMCLSRRLAPCRSIAVLLWFRCCSYVPVADLWSAVPVHGQICLPRLCWEQVLTALDGALAVNSCPAMFWLLS